MPIWSGRVSPVFDSAGELLLLDIQQGQVTARDHVAVDGAEPLQRVSMLADKGVTTLICGAVSRLLADWLAARGVEVLPFVCGDVEEVISAFLDGRLPSDELTMPGCCGRWRNRCGCPATRDGAPGPRFGGGRGAGRGPGRGASPRRSAGTRGDRT